MIALYVVLSSLLWESSQTCLALGGSGVSQEAAAVLAMCGRQLPAPRRDDPELSSGEGSTEPQPLGLGNRQSNAVHTLGPSPLG